MTVARWQRLSEDALLAHIRRLVSSHDIRGRLTEHEVSDLVRFVDLLDECLSAGGPYPACWALVPKQREVTDLPPLLKPHQ